jgi:hypothetical protein
MFIYHLEILNFENDKFKKELLVCTIIIANTHIRL